MHGAHEEGKLIRVRLQKANIALAQHEASIKNKEVAATLLRLAKSLLSDVDTTILPYALQAQDAYISKWYDIANFQLGQAEEQIRHVGDLIVKFGPDIQLIGDSGGSRFKLERGIMGRR